MALYIPDSIFHLARLLYFRPETLGPTTYNAEHCCMAVNCCVARFTLFVYRTEVTSFLEEYLAEFLKLLSVALQYYIMKYSLLLAVT